MTIIDSVRAEYLRYKALGEAAMRQLSDAELLREAPEESENSIPTICRHIAGNLRSRFTDFLTSDGEKPWRNREAEFDAVPLTREELLATWEAGWGVLLQALDALSDDDLRKSVTIRGQALTVHEALHRSLAHTSYHVGQIVYVAKAARGGEWTSLSIPRGKSAAYNLNPKHDRPDAQTTALGTQPPPVIAERDRR